MNKVRHLLKLLLLVWICLCSGCVDDSIATFVDNNRSEVVFKDGLPVYDGKPYVVLNQNQPEFSEDELTTKAYESYGQLDELGRCSVATASIGQELMPTESRGNISSVKPTGWHSIQYDCVDGKSLYNRCHLIGFQLTGENANEYNLITGTRYLNTQGMLPFENMVADYIKETNNHVAYRVTPVFKDDNLVADGVKMEAYSIEDDGEGICFNVYCFNIQPQVVIDYATGDSYLEGQKDYVEHEYKYVLNTNTMKVHKIECSHVEKINEQNYQVSNEELDELLKQGYSLCKTCLE